MYPPRPFCNLLAFAALFAAVPSAYSQAQPAAAPKPAAPAPPPKPKFPEERGLISFGFLAGGHLRDLLQSGVSSTSQVADASGHLVVGPALQIRWPRFILEVDALYRGFGTRSSGNLLGVSFENRATGRIWEFPVLAKRPFFPKSKVRPVVGAGVALRYLGQNSVLSAAGTTNSATSTVSRDYIFGLPLAAAIEIREGRFHFTPEFRYTLWAADSGVFPVRGQGIFDSNNNQFQVLMGITF